MRLSPSRPTLPAVALAAAMLAGTLAGCTTVVSGQAGGQGGVLSGGAQGGVDPAFVHGTDGGDIDRLAAAVVTDVQDYWRASFPGTFDKQWTELRGGYFSVDTAHDDGQSPPCTDKANEVEGNAFYCPTADMVAWDRAALLPVLRDRFGEASVMLVLAHEMGHAVQQRTSPTQADRHAKPDSYPTILIEAEADCYAGTFVRWVADGHATHLEITKDRLDSALSSLISFRDPIGTEQDAQGAHGDAFDRISAFQDGYEHGAAMCAGMTVDNRTFTLRGFTKPDDYQRGGNLPFGEIVRSVTPVLNTYFGDLLGQHGKQWHEPKITGTQDVPSCSGDQGPVAYCPDSGEVDYQTTGELPGLHVSIGDYATGTLIASRYAVAALAADGKPVTGADAQRGAVCLAGGFAGSLFASRQDFLSPGDLDEAVQVVLDYDYAARDTAGQALESGFDRVVAFRQGFTQGGRACGVS